MSNCITTNRLMLRQPLPNDIDEFAAMNADPRTMRYVGQGVPYDRQKSEATLAMFIEHWKRHGFGLWMLRDRQSEAFIGFTGFHHPDGQDGIELGWRLRSDCWGDGYAFEAATFCLNYAKDHFTEKRLIHRIQTENTRSIKLALKLGGRLVTHETDGDRDVSVYETRLGHGLINRE